MNTIVCFFQWLPHNYNYRAGVMTVFNIESHDLVSLRIDRRNNTVIFNVASQETFNRLSQFCRGILFFPILGHYILECFALPASPRLRVLKLSGLSSPDVIHSLNGFLSEIGTVLYQRPLRFSVPLLSIYRSDCIGVVLLSKEKAENETNYAITTPSICRSPGNGQENQQPVRPASYVPVAGTSSGGTTYNVPAGNASYGLPSSYGVPGYLFYHGIGILQQDPYQYQGVRISNLQANEAHPYRQNSRWYRSQFNYGEHSGASGLSYPPQVPIQDEYTVQEPTSTDGEPTEMPVEDQNQGASSDEQEQE
ncbi:uncharacterized protein LOC126298925 isoform X2 [Schistocerca gregaria]|uniref:uncharacterized protein LOC126298925 isoform X2 n=1 Tax=Schistocerca gregaria TaxID=7010 RepID=UPI00211DB7F0|nr:uncharacterized protein LOC126298925 isoform X2 [Schistocerca gregaria]